MNKKNIVVYCYELGYKGESSVSLTSDEAQEVRQILLAKDNFTYSELEGLEAETVDLIYDVIQAYNQGQEFKSKLDNKSYESESA